MVLHVQVLHILCQIYAQVFHISDAIVNDITFTILISDCLLLKYRNAIDL